jgi:hypothetical protein
MMTKELQIPEEVINHPAWHRLQNQRVWYSKESAKSKKKYHQSKITQIILAAVIPVVTLIDFSSTKYVVALFGATIAVIEGIQQLFQYHTLWFDYRSTSEHLKHEQFLFLSLSGPYRDFSHKKGLLLLAERIEEHISKEHAKWVDTSKKASLEMTKEIEKSVNK